MNIFKVFVRNMSQEKWKPLNKAGIIGVPFEKGQKKNGVCLAPSAMRSANLIERLEEIDGLDVKDYGDINTPNQEQPVKLVNNMAHISLVSECNKKLSEKVSQILKDDRVAVTIGGDHSIGVGTIDGHYKEHQNMILIWVDAHADLNTNATSASGSVHGMPVALLVNELADNWPYLPTMEWQVPNLETNKQFDRVRHRMRLFSIKNLAYIGLRSVDSYETLTIKNYNVPAFAMKDIDELGIHKSIRHVLQVLDPDENRPIHVSFDIDSLDALEAPSTGTPVRGGLTLREAVCLMEIIHSTGRLRAIDLVEINPALGNENDRKKTIEAGICILQAALGFSRRGTAPRGMLKYMSFCPLWTSIMDISGRKSNALVENYFGDLKNNVIDGRNLKCGRFIRLLEKEIAAKTVEASLEIKKERLTKIDKQDPCDEHSSQETWSRKDRKRHTHFSGRYIKPLVKVRETTSITKHENEHDIEQMTRSGRIIKRPRRFDEESSIEKVKFGVNLNQDIDNTSKSMETLDSSIEISQYIPVTLSASQDIFASRTSAETVDTSIEMSQMIAVTFPEATNKKSRRSDGECSTQKDNSSIEIVQEMGSTRPRRTTRIPRRFIDNSNALPETTQRINVTQPKRTTKKCRRSGKDRNTEKVRQQIAVTQQKPDLVNTELDSTAEQHKFSETTPDVS